MVQQVSPELTPAPVTLRALAFVLDVLILITVNLAFSSLLSAAGADGSTIFAAIVAVQALYYIGFTVYRSATPGKIAMRIYVSDLEGRPVAPDTAILRFLVYFVGGAIIAGSVISALLVLNDPKRRTVHDRIARTLVVVGRPAYEDKGWS